MISGSSVQFSCSFMSDSLWPHGCQGSLSITNSRSLLKLMSIEPLMPSNHFILRHPPLLLSSIFPSIRVFSNESVLCIKWPKYWSFSFSICPNDHYINYYSSSLAWKIPGMEEPGGLQSMGLLRVRHDWATSLSLFTFMHWRRKWQPTPVFLPGESQGWWSLVDCRLWGCTESDMTEAT